jgi:hypothetical protein
VSPSIKRRASAPALLPERSRSCPPAMQRGPARVSEPGNAMEFFYKMHGLDDVPSRYADHPDFQALASDPAIGNKMSTSSMREVMTGLEAQQLGYLIPSPVRGPPCIEFYDGLGAPYDVKTPPSPWPSDQRKFDPKQAGDSILLKLGKRAPNAFTDKQQPIRILLDVTYLATDDHQALWNYLRTHATPNERARIYELNVKLD